jgi:hypothetical protein
MKTLLQLLQEAQPADQPEYLRFFLGGKDEILAFAAGVRLRTIEECQAALTTAEQHYAASKLETLK